MKYLYIILIAKKVISPTQSKNDSVQHMKFSIICQLYIIGKSTRPHLNHETFILLALYFMNNLIRQRLLDFFAKSIHPYGYRALLRYSPNPYPNKRQCGHLKIYSNPHSCSRKSIIYIHKDEFIPLFYRSSQSNL